MDNSKISENPSLEVYIRRSDLDDIEAINKLITPESWNHLNQLYDYPNPLNLFQKSYISLTVLNSDQNVIGAACFDDAPVGLRGKYDNVHENLWEEWLGKAFNLEGIPISSYNSLWLTFLHIDQKYLDTLEYITQKLLQSLYVLQPQLEGILFLRRGEVQALDEIEDAYRILRAHFLEFKLTDSGVLRQLIGINSKSKAYYSPKSYVIEDMEIRMARQEDHDDLAQIFNRQSEVVTEQFGEFFIADLIATQNLTRRMNKGGKSEGRAIVGQVRDKAIGLMSISTEIDYKLLNEHFELKTFDHLIKSDILEAIEKRHEMVKFKEERKRLKQKRELQQKIKEQRIKAFKIGQRVLLQNYCVDREAVFKNEFNNVLKEEPKNQNLDDQGFQKILERCLKDFQLYIPSEIFAEYPEYATDLETIIMSPSEFFIETLEYFGLPKNYVKREGHWKDWAKSILEKRMDDQLRRPKAKKGATKKKGNRDKKEEDNDLKPPEHFDLSPLNEAYLKFISVGAQVRTLFRQELKEKLKKVVMLFCDQNGQMINERNVDMNTLGKMMNENGILVSPQVVTNMSSLLQTFGGVGFQQRMIQIQQKVEQKKALGKKEAVPKMVNITQKLISYHDFEFAMDQIKIFDIQLAKLGYLNSPTLDVEVKAVKEEEESKFAIEEEANAREWNFGQFQMIVNQINVDEFPEIPYEYNNGIVVNLFCIDEMFQARSLDFVEYAFTLFPERDYIIITQPFTIPESTLVKHFIQVPRKKNSTFQHCLYIFHKDSMYAKDIKVRRSTANDLTRANYLLHEMKNSEEITKNIKNSITETSSQFLTFTVECGPELIGMYTISKNVNLDYYVSHFFVQDHIILNQHPRQKHGKVVYSLINPLFNKSVRFILKQIMRLTGKTCLYFEVHNRTLLPDIFNEFTPLRMRSFPHFLQRKWNFTHQPEDLQRRLTNKKGIDMDRDASDEKEAPFSLSILTKKDIHQIKQNNNTRIVVVGASDTGISFIQSLLTIKSVTFTNIMLLSPGGLITMHVKNKKDFLRAASTSYSLEQIRNLMIDARTTVMDAKMVKLDKKNKRILIDKNAYIPYDLLILSVGLIDTLLQNHGLISSGLLHSPYYKDKPCIKGVYSIDDPYLYEHFSSKSANIKLLKRKKKPQNITIYGRTPHTIALISGLISRGVAPQRIYFVVPGSSRRRNTYFETNQDRIDYDSQLINDPDTFEDPNVEKLVIDQLRMIGVNVQLGFQFHKIEENSQSECTGLKFRKKAENYDELDELIKEKKKDMQEKQQQDMGNKIDDYQDDSEDDEEKVSPEREIELLEMQQWRELQTPASFFITSGLVDIDREIFNIIHENGLVYNGRLIVKSNFQTTENQIFACGRICEFSQRYKNYAVGRSLRLDRYNGRELGTVLGQHVLEILNLSHLTIEKYTEDELPKFHMPVGLGSALFQDTVYYYIKRAENSQPKTVLEKGLRSQELISKNIKESKGHYLRFLIDPNGMIESVSYMGNQDVSVPSLVSFVGLSLSYLNKVGKRNDMGMIPDIAEFLSENWAICLYHELFSQFRHYVKKSLSASAVSERLNNRVSEKAMDGECISQEFMNEIKSLLPEDVVRQIREGTIDFIRRNYNHLPMYYLPVEN